MSAGTGDVALGVVGATTALTGLTVTGGTITLSSVTTNGAQNYTGATSLSSNYITGGGSFAVNGATSLTTATAITTNNGGLSFNGGLNGVQVLSLTAGNGAVTFGGSGGTTAQPLAITIASAGDVTIQDAMSVATFTQNSGTGLTDFGTSGLTASGDVSVSTKRIAGIINGNTVSLLATELVSGTVTSTSLFLSGNSIVLSGTVGGTDGEEAVLKIIFSGDVGSGPYTFNGLPIFPGQLLASNGQTFSSEIASQANSQSATASQTAQTGITGSIASGAVPNTTGGNLGQLAFSQDWTFSPAVSNVFESSFALVSVQLDSSSTVDAELAVDLAGDIQTDAEQANVVFQDQETQAFFGDFWSFVLEPVETF